MVLFYFSYPWAWGEVTIGLVLFFLSSPLLVFLSKPLLLVFLSFSSPRVQAQNVVALIIFFLSPFLSLSCCCHGPSFFPLSFPQSTIVLVTLSHFLSSLQIVIALVFFSFSSPWAWTQLLFALGFSFFLLSFLSLSYCYHGPSFFSPLLEFELLLHWFFPLSPLFELKLLLPWSFSLSSFQAWGWTLVALVFFTILSLSSNYYCLVPFLSPQAQAITTIVLISLLKFKLLLP